MPTAEFRERKTFMSDFEFPISSSWNSAKLMSRGPLTDKKIEKYRKAGWYSAELKEMRRERNQKRMAKREGNFLKQTDGSMIYSPL